MYAKTIDNIHRISSLPRNTPSYTKREYHFHRSVVGVRPFFYLLKLIEYFGKNPQLEKVRERDRLYSKK